MDRRSFLAWAGLGAVATSLPVALAACSRESASSSGETTPSEPAAPTESAAEFVAVGNVSALEGSGVISDGKFAGGSGKLIVFRAGASADDDIVALDAKCPHAGCAVDWDGSELICPCHDSKFSADGSLTSGPAQEGLNRFEVKVEGDQVLVKTT